MAYKKFDDPGKSTYNAKRNVYSAEMHEAMRRALQGIANRVVGYTTGGTAGTGYLSTGMLGTGTTAGVKINSPTVVIINGVQSTCISQDNLYCPSYGTMGTREVAKFLVCTATGTSGTVIGPGNIVNANDYATDALAIAACKLPDLPDGYCALGYYSLIAPRTTAVVVSSKSSLGLASTAGTVAWQDLVCMPYDG